LLRTSADRLAGLAGGVDFFIFARVGRENYQAPLDMNNASYRLVHNAPDLADHWRGGAPRKELPMTLVIGIVIAIGYVLESLAKLLKQLRLFKKHRR
jgi:hypothetical protein